MNTNATLTAGPATAPKRVITAQGIIVRYGFQPIGDSGGYAKYVEHLFAKMPSVETLRTIVEGYNAETGINETFNPEDYGFRS